MGDPGFLSEFIYVSIGVAIHHIFHHIRVALRCKEELNSLRDLVMRIRPIISQIQQYRLALNRNRGIPISQSDLNIRSSAINQWLEKLDSLLLQASAMAQDCTIPSYDLISRYKTSRRITRLITVITQHLEILVPLMGSASVREGLGHTRESVVAAFSASISETTFEPLASTGFFISESLIVGQQIALESLEKLVTDAEARSPFSRIGVVGKGGSGKTLLLKTLFNSQTVRNFFRDGLLLWLTVSQSPSFSSLRNELSKQIAMQTKVGRHTNESMHANRFALFLDDVWENVVELLEELDLHQTLIHFPNSKIIVSSRNYSAVLEMGVSKESTITIGDLSEDDSWRLFSCHAFPYNNGKLPPDIDERMAKAVCDRCGGLPLAMKAVGRAMAGVTDANEWSFAVQRLPNANNNNPVDFYDSLRLSYDALGSYSVNLQLCFLYLAAFSEDEVIPVETEVIPLWVGEGLLSSRDLHQDEPDRDLFEMGRIYIKILADRCLIEPTLTDVDGRVHAFRMHDLLRDLAIKIATQEENFSCNVGRGLTEWLEIEWQGCARILLNDNKLSSLPQSLRASEVCSLLMARNAELREIPFKVIRSMTSLKVLDLSGTSLQSLPNSIGCLKQLSCLRLVNVPIKRLPASLTSLRNLQILVLIGSSIIELPPSIHKLRSLTYLDLLKCKNLKTLPPSFAGLTSLQFLHMNSPWIQKKRHSTKVASINDLGRFTQLRRLYLENNGESVNEGTLGSMVQMDALQLTFTVMARLPGDIINMSSLRRLALNCPHLTKLESTFCVFQNLNHLRLNKCDMLEELPELHKLTSLRQLDIVSCSNLRKFPEGSGETGAFCSLEIFSLAMLDGLQELPELVKNGAMPSLQIFTIMLCGALQMLPRNYFNLSRLQKLRVFGCNSTMLEELSQVQRANINPKVKIVTMSTTETHKILESYWQVAGKIEDWLYDMEWCGELYHFLKELYKDLL